MEEYKMDRKDVLFQCEKDIDFLNSHPALNMGSGDFFNTNFIWSMWQICKNGVIKEHFISAKNVQVWLNKGDKRFDELIKIYRDADDTDEDVADPSYTLYVPYREVYGCEWEFEKYEYLADVSIIKFDKEKLKKGEHFYPQECFSRFQGCHVSCDTYEDSIISIAKLVRQTYGDFSYDSFFTDEEKENHKTERAFNMEIIPESDRNDKGGRNYLMVDNLKYLEVSDAQLNLRWWDWFRKTDYYKKTWDGE